ncbi:MAG: helix-turn-helix transcriptional regulator [Candidatus Omnitrophica bacterium]|nr:helix-turn-helix transcriptional regulator [Candidatus Omnitrophota bacterium]
MNLGDQIRNLRKARGLFQKELAHKIGVSPKTVCAWEKGINEPNPNQRRKLCQELGITEAELFGAGRVAETPDEYSAKKKLIEKLQLSPEDLQGLTEEDWQMIHSVLGPLIKKLLERH